MDKTEKLHKLQELREKRDIYKSDAEYWLGVYKEALAVTNNQSNQTNGSSAQKSEAQNLG